MFSCRSKNVFEGTFYQESGWKPTVSAGKAWKIADSGVDQKFALHKKSGKAS